MYGLSGIADKLKI